MIMSYIYLFQNLSINANSLFFHLSDGV